MPRWRTLILGLLTGLLVGCATGKPAFTTSWLDSWRPFHGPTGSDVVQMDVAFLERPVGDPIINKELWILADEQAIPLERKAELEENGFRVGQLGGIKPAALQNLLTSERSCINPRRLSLHAGNPTSLVLGAQIPLCRFQIKQVGQPTAVSLEQAECSLNVVPSLTNDGCVRLQFTPQVRHGETTHSPWAVDDRSGWILHNDKAAETYSALTWEITLSPNHYVIVGARAERPETLGYQCFLRRNEPVPVQRLLVIRAYRARTEPALDPSLESPEEDSSVNRTPPLALQATWTKARGSAP